MKVLLTAASLQPAYGGPAFSVTGLAAALARQGVELGLWAADGSAKTTPLLPADAPIIRLDGSPDAALAAFGRPDVIHDNGIWLPHNHRLARLATRGGIARLVSLRGMLEPWAMRHKRWKKRIAWALYQRGDLAAADVLHATAEQEGANAARYGFAAPIRIVPNGVDLPPFVEPLPDDPARPRTALFLGRLYPVKGLPMLIGAWARLRPAGWRLDICGPDEAGHRAELERLIARLGLQEIVRLRGEVAPEARAATYASADLFVLPSHSENFGMVVAEALAAGLPVITTTGTPWSGLPERGCGWWIAPDEDAIEGALRQATALDRTQLREMGGRGRSYVGAEFGWDGIAARFCSLYGEMRDRRRTS